MKGKKKGICVMAGLRNLQVLIIELLLCFFLCQFPYMFSASSVNLASVSAPFSWKNNPFIEQGSWKFADGSTYRPILMLDTEIEPPCGFGFFTNQTADANSFYLAVFFLTISSSALNSNIELPIQVVHPPIVAWSANRDDPVRENATVNFTDEGDLILRDADGSLVWSTNTSGRSVSRLNLTSTGNLMLLGEKDEVVWQSFDYPTDSWLPNQNILVGKTMVARDSASTLASGQSFISFTPDGMDAFIGHDPPLKYATYSFPLRDNVSSVEKFPNYYQFTVRNLSTGFPYMVLAPDGHINKYRSYRADELRYGFMLCVIHALKAPSLDECDYPTSCGDFGVCLNGNCTCPGGNSNQFVLVDESRPALGCKRVTPLSCGDQSLHSMVELKDVTYFNFVPSHSNTDMKSCKEACLMNCSCIAAIFHYEDNNTIGNCSLQSSLYSLKASKKGEGFNSYALIKIQKSPKRNERHLVLVLAPSLSIGLVFILVAMAYYHYKLKMARLDEDRDEEVTAALRKFSFLELKQATRGFKVKLGQGGFGSVFEGFLTDGTKVAVKLLEPLGQGKKEFLAEVNTVGNTHHFNLVRLIGYCAEKLNRLLVYENMSNGSLDKWIFPRTENADSLPWEIRRKIIVDIARGLEYLHVHCDPIIIHFDVKPQNILLDSGFNAKISDFGLAKLMNRDQSQVRTALKGTPGYMAPEMLNGRNISAKADVFGFGVVTLEIICCQKNLDSSDSEPLVDVAKNMAQRDQLLDLIDEQEDEFYKEEAMKMIKVALWCLEPHDRRPCMSVVVKVLEGLLDVESIAPSSFSTSSMEMSLYTSSCLSTNSCSPYAMSLSGPR